MKEKPDIDWFGPDVEVGGGFWRREDDRIRIRVASSSLP